MNNRDHISRNEIRKAIEELSNANPSYSHTCDVVERDEVFEIIDGASEVSDQDTIKELWNCRNELCLRCGKYENAHRGACDDCRYNAKNMSKYKRERGGAK